MSDPGNVQIVEHGCGYRFSLPWVDERICCSRCGWVVALRCDSSILIKAHNSVITDELILLACGNCQNITSFSRDGKKKLAI